MLSGIGDADELERHGIEVKMALPGVGKNLQDHVSVILMYRRARAQPVPAHDALRPHRPELPKAYFFGTGFAADVPGGVSRIPQERPELARPDIQILLTAAPLGAWPYLQPFKAPFPDGFAQRIVMLHPESRGRSAIGQPIRAPIRAFFRASSTPTRIEQTVRAGVRLARDIAAQPSMKPYIAAEFLPGPDKATDARSTPMSARPPSPCTIPSAPARWEQSRTSPPWSTPTSRCEAPKPCAWSTPR